MPSAASYTNKLRVAAQIRSRKVQLPGGVADATQSMRSACNIPMSYAPVDYNVPCPCHKFSAPIPPICKQEELVYFSDDIEASCVTLDGGAISTSNAVVYDGGVDCI